MLYRQRPRLDLRWRHGDDENAVFAELCQIVEEAIQAYKSDNKPLPPKTSGDDYANKLLSVA
jgi:hypothetical protein